MHPRQVDAPTPFALAFNAGAPMTGCESSRENASVNSSSNAVGASGRFSFHQAEAFWMCASARRVIRICTAPSAATGGKLRYEFLGRDGIAAICLGDGQKQFGFLLG